MKAILKRFAASWAFIRPFSAMRKTLLILFFIFFGAYFFAICAFTFNSRLNLLTWAFAILFMAVAVLYLILYGIIKAGPFAFAMLGYPVVILLSACANRLPITDASFILYVIPTLIIYEMAIQDPQIKRLLIATLLFSFAAFEITFVAATFKSLLSFHFSVIGTEFGQINFVGSQLAFGSVLAFACLLDEKGPGLKITSFLVFALGLAELFLTQSRGSLISLIVPALVLTMIKNGKKHWYISLILVLFLTVGLVLILSLPSLSVLRSKTLNTISTLFGLNIPGTTVVLGDVGRVEMIYEAFSLFLKKPLLGWGYRSFMTMSYHSTYAHNTYLDLLTNLGILGLLSILVLFIRPIIVCIDELRHKKKKGCSVVLIVFAFLQMLTLVSVDSKTFFILLAVVAFLNEDGVYMISISFKPFSRSFSPYKLPQMTPVYKNGSKLFAKTRQIKPTIINI